MGDWSPYNINEKIDSAKRSLNEAITLRSQYNKDITSLNIQLKNVMNNDYSPERIPRINNIKSSISNLEFALRGICSNVRAMELRLKRLEDEKRDSRYYNETRNCNT